MDYEVAIVGGGVAGLSAALGLARCNRRIFLCDEGRPRNAVSRGVHAFLTRDGTPPIDFLRMAREQVLAYPCVTFQSGRVEDAERREGGFVLRLADGSEVTAQKLLLATGLVDELPAIEGFDRFWGHSAFVCPFCDGWEVRGKRLVLLGREADVYGFALELRQWSRELFLCTDGSTALSGAQRRRLERLGVRVHDERIQRLEGEGQQVECVRFADGTCLPTEVVFLTTTQRPASPLPERLACPMTDEGTVQVCRETCSAAPGVWIAGNAMAGLQLAIIAAAEGMKAAHSINESLVQDEIGPD